MPARKVNFEKLHAIELDHYLPEFGNGSIWEAVDHDVYKHAQERFVSNLNGTSAMEVFGIIAVIPMLFLTLHVIKDKCYSSNIFHFIFVSKFYSFVLEFVVIIVPTVFMLTDFISYYLFFGIQLLIILCAAFSDRGSTNQVFSVSMHELAHTHLCDRNNNKSKKLNYISYTRTALMILTMISILAVDFTVFPRRFAKCETYGISVMDIGVGCFMSSAGAISSFTTMNKSKSKPKTKAQRFLPLLAIGVLGFGRFFVLKIFDYHSHASEYGLHWNFFISLFIVSLFSKIVNAWNSNSSSNLVLIIVCVVCAAYQYILLMNNEWITDWILDADRNHNRSASNFWFANREGIIACIGFFTLYQIGFWFGCRFLRVNNHNKDGNGTRKRNQIELKSHLFKFIFVDVLSVELFAIVVGLISHFWIQSMSRRLANIAYICFVVASDVWLILLFLLSIFVLANKSTSILIQSIDDNQLVLFLFANILTGVINVSFRTLFATPAVAYAIIISYMFIVCSVAFALKQNNIQLSTKLFRARAKLSKQK